LLDQREIGRLGAAEICTATRLTHASMELQLYAEARVGGFRER